MHYVGTFTTVTFSDVLCACICVWLHQSEEEATDPDRTERHSNAFHSESQRFPDNGNVNIEGTDGTRINEKRKDEESDGDPC